MTSQPNAGAHLSSSTLGASFERTAILTMDIEPDYARKSGVGRRHYALFDDDRQFSELIDLLNRLKVRMTCFVVSESLTDRPDAIAELGRTGAEFACHSYSHDLAAVSSDREVCQGIDSFADFFGYRPFAYRTPQGRINRSILDILEREQVLCDSSVVPSFRPGVYSNLHHPILPFRWHDSPVIEIPISVLPLTRIPLSLSYMKLLGPSIYCKLSQICGLPDPLTFLTHPMDFQYSPCALGTLSRSMRFAYRRNQQRSLELFRLFVETVVAAQYTLTRMSDALVRISRQDLPKVPLPRQ